MKKELTQEQKQVLLQKVEAVRATAVAKLGRPEGSRLTNAGLNEILAEYKKLGYKDLEVINENLQEIKPAKSIGQLAYNISKQLQAGLRSDRSILNLEDLF